MPKSAWVLMAVVVVISVISGGCASPRVPAEAGFVSHNDDPLVRKLLAQAVAGQQEWQSGSSQLAAQHMAHTPTFTIFGPFGGPSPAGWSEELARVQAATARQFQGGTTDIELVQSYVSDDLIVLVTIERNQVRFAGQEGLRRWDLRVTQVCQRDGDTWKLVHRHADPLVARRDFKETLELLEHP
jgi:hypothetical protein